MTPTPDAPRDSDPEKFRDSSADWDRDAAVYERLRRAARRMIRRHARDDVSIDSPGLVGEAALRVLGSDRVRENPDPRYAYRAYTKAMRDILADRHRWRTRQKNGAGMRRVPLDPIIDRLAREGAGPDDLDQAIETLRRDHPVAAEVLTLRFFLELGPASIARQLGTTKYQAEMELAKALGWLRRQWRDGPG